MQKIPIAQSKITTEGHSPIISVNGTTGAVLRQITGSLTKVFASKATRVEFTAVGEAPNERDALPPLPPFCKLVVADGKLYVGTNKSLVTYCMF